MRFRPAQATDLDAMMRIIDQAKVYLRGLGIDQWQSGYPDRETLAGDIRKGDAYVLEDAGEVVGTTAVVFDGEPSYAGLTGGAWLSDGPYAVIHRMALSNDRKGQGLSTVFLKEVENLCLGRGVHSIKADTHPGNPVMQIVLSRNGFAPCGTIVFEGSEKLAYEKLLR